MTGVERMRAEFDRSFEEPSKATGEGRLDFVLVMVGKMLLALPVGELQSIEHGTELVEVPSKAQALAGLSAVRGVVLPVFSLGVLLGSGGAASEAWRERPVFALAESAEGDRVGLGFDKLLQFVRVEADAVPGCATVLHEEEMYRVVPVGEMVRQIVAG